jgi:hypothetical protein
MDLVTPLLDAAATGDQSAVVLFLDLGADLKLADEGGTLYTSYYIARDLSHYIVTSLCIASHRDLSASICIALLSIALLCSIATHCNLSHRIALHRNASHRITSHHSVLHRIAS